MFDFLTSDSFEPASVAPYAGIALGLAFGLLAEPTRFCFRRALLPGPDRRAAAGVWLTALALAVLATQFALLYGLVDFSDHRFLDPELPLRALLLGGALFGAGMVLSRGCVARLTVLAGSGNLRAVLGIGVFAVTALATQKGVLAPLRQAVSEPKLLLDSGALPGAGPLLAALIAFAALTLASRSGAKASLLLCGALIGLLAAAGWVLTGYLLQDPFDPLPLASLSFTAASADGLFWLLAASALTPGFSTGLIAGVMLGAVLASLSGRRFHWQSFEDPAQTGRALLGAMLMGFGGVLAGGCTLGAGLSGIPSLGLAPLITLVAIAAGGLACHHLLSAFSSGSAGSSTRQSQQPAG